jgi:hypothetical protein
MIKPCFLRVNVGLVCGMWGRGIEEGGRERLKIFGRWKTFISSVEERNGKISMYFVCASNGRWLKDSKFLCCIDVLLSVEGRIVLVIIVVCFFWLIFLHFF